ncbi:MAG TPA: HNH endonuclease [Sideroxyarcus sp.]|nr:HNH endonuclease [Sideroxyarcus sp.]
MKQEFIITQALLKELLEYDAMTGIFNWKAPVNIGIKIGDVAGCIDKKGYSRIKIFGKKYLSHRLAWLYVFGHLPKSELDHISGVKTDNRISNLRPATRIQNNCNTRIRKDNSSGFKGVSLRSDLNKWCARISVNGRRFFLGCFDTAEEAAAQYTKSAIELHKDFYREAV